MSATRLENRTKYALDSALRQLLEHKPLDQIRIRELTDLCMIRRQSFYYHFPDVHALFDWSLQQEREALLARQDGFLTGYQALTDLSKYIANHRPYYRALLETRGQTGLRDILTPALTEPLKKMLDYYQCRSGTPRNAQSEQNQLDCWETLLLALLESWIQDDLQDSPESILSLLEGATKQGSIGSAWQNLPVHGS